MMPNLWERRLMLSVSMGRHHLVLDNFRTMGRGAVVLLILVIIVSTVEVGRTFVFTGTAMLLSVSK